MIERKPESVRVDPRPKIIDGAVKDSLPLTAENLYFQEVAKFPLLTRGQELFLFRQLRLGKTVEEIKADPTFTSEIKPGQTEKFDHLIYNSKSIKEMIINANLRLVIHNAKRFSGDMLDLIQEGNIGLEKALEDFEPEKGYKFSTYATWWIAQKMRRSLANGGIVRLPVYLYGKINHARRISDEFALRTGREPTDEELKEEMVKNGIPKMTAARTIDTMRSNVLTVASLDKPLREDGDLLLGDIIPAPHDIEEEVVYADTRKKINQALDLLTEKERHVIVTRFGLGDDGINKTLGDAGKDLGLTRERVRQIQLSAMTKLRESGLLADFSASPESFISSPNKLTHEAVEKNPNELTSREDEVFVELKQGKTAGEIADDLGLSVGTVRNIKRRLRVKLKATGDLDTLPENEEGENAERMREEKPFLSLKQIDVIYFLAQGMKISEIASRLNIAQSGVRVRIMRIKEKLEVTERGGSGRDQIVEKSIALGLIDNGKDKKIKPLLTPKEAEVVGLLREGLTPVKIGERLKISSSYGHLRNIRRKLGIDKIDEIVPKCKELGLESF